MKTFTSVICFLLSAIASVPAGASIRTTDEGSSANGAAFTICLEAENGNGDGPISSDPNASNGLTRGFRNSSDYFVDYVTDVPSTAKYQVTLRYYAERNSLVNVSVNGGSTFQVELPASHSWNIAWTEYTFEVNLTAGNNGVRVKELPGYDVRQDKTCWTEIPGTEWPITCDFKVNPQVVGNVSSYRPGQMVTLDAGCTGADCNAASLSWFGNNTLYSGGVVSFNAPETPGDYSYRLGAFRKGCVNDTSVTLSIRVDTTPADCEFTVGSIVSDYTPSCTQPLTVTAECFGAGCAGVTYRLTGPDINGTGNTINFYAPSQNGTYSYTRTGSKPGCPDISSNFQLTISDCGSQPFQACIEAEDAQGNAPISEDPNASGGKTRGGQAIPDNYVEYVVWGVQVDGPHAITLRYYAEANTAVEVKINDEPVAHKIELEASHSWNIVWTERTLLFTLKKGVNMIRVKGYPGYSPVRQDRLCIMEMPGTPPACDFNITASPSTPTPACGSQFTMTANCTGPDCGGVYYNWFDDGGFARYTQTIDVTAPSYVGSFYLSVAAGKDGCAQKIVRVPYQVTSCPPPGGVLTSACVEAEHSASNGPVSGDPNASNGQTRGSQNNYDYYVDYQLSGFVGGPYPLTIRYYAEADAQVSVSVNGTVQLTSVLLGASHSWNIVSREAMVYITVPDGNSIIRIQGLPGAPVRQDKICVGTTQSNARMAVPEFGQSQTDDPQLQAFPNPAPGEFKAVFDLKTGETGSMLVTDVQGKVWHTRHVSGKGRHEERISLPHAPAGIYLLQVKKPDSVETKKILLTR
ncbi:MAG: hypothetical protein BGO21_17420 [Dyadobacter sp. 50-39]|uniref:T9SS type A sorting domain-containing protein n=1 Tax=Dyadobacter sp. 50-39 TaxID=1895756 RepID=UPI000964277A|nr:T9SS type A sorting domain-containing protein [Dyadobacter sp. 50-39]OJV14500.1 MAG: hypothetical protein BGO21_17420 [Dyadobacter sp. 50-39]